MHLPQYLILDAYGWILRLRGAALLYQERYPCCADECFVTDVVALLIDLIRDHRRAEPNLRTFEQDVRAGTVDCGADYLPAAFAPLVWACGMDLLAQLEHAQAYFPNGVLPYHFHLLQPPQANVTVILELTNELPPL